MTDESHGAHPSQSHQPVDPAESADSAKASEPEPTQPDAGPLEPQDAPDVNGSQNPHPQKAGLRRRRRWMAGDVTMGSPWVVVGTLGEA